MIVDSEKKSSYNALIIVIRRKGATKSRKWIPVYEFLMQKHYMCAKFNKYN